MSRRNASEIVDGFTTMQAAQRAVTSGKKAGKSADKGDKPPKNAESVEPEKTHAPAPGNVRIGHTAQPARHDIVCYECGFAFLVTGKLQQTYCPKCREMLQAGEQSIAGKWSGQIKTIGTVKVEKDGAVTGGSIVAGTVVLSGRIEGGKVKAVTRLVMCDGGQFSRNTVDASAIRIEKDASIRFHREIHVQDIEVLGKLSARMKVLGLVSIRPGGLFKGKIAGHHLEVDEGGGLIADLDIAPGHGDQEKTGQKEDEK